MLNYFLKRLLGLVPTLLIVAVLVFLFVHMLPGDPARLAAGQDADEQTVELVRQQLGLDRPLHEQFVHYFSRMLQADFGTSIRTRRPVSTEIAERFAALQALKIHPRDQQVNSALMARLERLYQECLGDVREHVGALAGHFAGVLERQDEREIRDAHQDISARLEAIESGY